MSLAYAPRGLFGILTPQANTTVEPELGILMPPGHAFIAARMTSGKPSMTDRLVDYFDRLDATLAEFANAPVAAVGIACTGASYLAGRPRETAIVAGLEAAHGYPVITAGAAIAAALDTLGARRVAIVSPYDAALTEASLGYWASHGIDIVAVSAAEGDAGAFHPIYSLGADAAEGPLAKLATDTSGAEAVVLLGTGLPTLGPILRTPFAGGAPVLSSNLCLAWRLVAGCDPATADRAGLLDWVQARHWRAAHAARLAD